MTLTPAEQVRQHSAQYLTRELGVLRGLMTVEAGLKFQGPPQQAGASSRGRQGDLLLLLERTVPPGEVGQGGCAIGFDRLRCRFLEDLPPQEALLDAGS